MSQLHVYGPKYWHCDAYIVGDRESLTILQEAITAALETGTGRGDDLFVTDGEGFDVKVICLANGDLEWEKLARPYVDECAAERRDDAVWPGFLWEKLEGE